MLLLLVRKIEKDHIWNLGEKTPVWFLLLLTIGLYGSIIEMVAGSCYNVILTGEPTSIDELKPYLYQSIRLIIQNHIVS